MLQGVVNTPQRLASLAVADALSGRTGRPLSALVPAMIDQYAPAGRLAGAPILGEDDSRPAAEAPIPTATPWDVQVSLPEEVEVRAGLTRPEGS